MTRVVMRSNHFQELNWFTIDSSEGEACHGLIGRNGHFIKLSRSAYTLLRLIHGGASFATVAQAVSRQQGQKVQAAEVETAYSRVVQKITAIERANQRSPTGFWFRFTCLPAALVNRVTPYLALTFHPGLVVCLLVAILATIAFVLQRETTTLVPVSISAFALFFGSVFFHELGHAAACRRYGARPREIGFTLYWIYPAFYSDVSTAWQLKRWQRVVVDLGGVFFQLIVGVVYVAIYLLTNWVPLLDAFVLILYSALFSLNPILKFDGYWVVADALGVTNLSRQTRRVFRYFIRRLRQRPVETLPWPPVVLIALSAFAVLSFSLWAYVMGTAVPPLLHDMFAYPSHLTEFVHHLQAEATFPSVTEWKAFFNASISAAIGFVFAQGVLRLLWSQAKAIVQPNKG